MTEQAILVERGILFNLAAEHGRCARAFRQDPSPRLGSVLKQIEGQIKYRKRKLAKLERELK